MTRYNTKLIAAAICVAVLTATGFAGADEMPDPVSATRAEAAAGSAVDTAGAVDTVDIANAAGAVDTVDAAGAWARLTEAERRAVDTDTAGAETETAEAAETAVSTKGSAELEASEQAEEQAAGQPSEQQFEQPAEQPAAPAPRARPSMSRLGRPGRLDGIAAVVGSEIILHSEVEAYAHMRLSAAGVSPDDIDVQALLRECLDELIDNKVLLVRAIEDSTINVRNDEVESTLNNHINMILRQNNITMEQLEAQLRIQQGTTLARFRTEARRAIREQLFKQKLQHSFFFSARLNRRDVERFYAQYADSLPEIGESFELLRLSLRLASSDSARQAAHDNIAAIRRRIDAGESFEDVAKELGDPSGGDLGYLVKGSTTEIAFEERAFTLPVGRVSEPFETRLGFHIILVEERRDMRVKLRQILVRHAPTEQQREAVVARLDSLRRSITAREGFEEAARTMSADQATRARGGDMGWVTLLEMHPAVRNAVHGLEEGQISAPVVEDNMLSIYMVSKRVDSRRLTLENDYPLIAEKARDIHAQKLLLDSVKKWRERVFIDIRI